MFVIRLNGLRADSEFFGDPAGPEPGTRQRKNMQLAVGQVRSV